MILLFCVACLIFPSFLAHIAAKEQPTIRTDDDFGIFGDNSTLAAVAVVAAAQQFPRIKSEERRAAVAAVPTADEQQQQLLLQSTQLFRTAANAHRSRSLVPSNEDRAQDESVQLRSVAKEVEEKLGLAAPAGTTGSRQWGTKFSANSKRDVPPPPAPSPLLRRFIGTAESAGGGLQRTRAQQQQQHPLVASLLRQQLLALQPNIVKPIIGSSFIGQQQQQQQFEREQQQQQQQQWLVQQQQLQTLLQQLGTFQQQRQLQQKLLLNTHQRQTVANSGRRKNERPAGGANRSSSTSWANNNIVEAAGNNNNNNNNNLFTMGQKIQQQRLVAPPPVGFNGPGPFPLGPPSSALFPAKTVPTSAAADVRLAGLSPPAATGPLFGGVLQPTDYSSKFVVQQPPYRPLSSITATDPVDLSALLQKIAAAETPRNAISSTRAVEPIAAKPSAPQHQERPLVVKLVTTAGNEQQTPNGNAIALQQIVLQEQQRVVELLEREQYREQLVQNNRKDLQSVQDKQQHILELLDALENDRRQQAIAARNFRANNNKQPVPKSAAAATTATTLVPTSQQQTFADPNLLKGLLQAFANLIASPQAMPTAGGFPTAPVPSATLTASYGGQPPSAGGQPLLNIGMAPNGAVTGPSQFLGGHPQQQQQQQLLAVHQQQQPTNSAAAAAVQYVAVYEPFRVEQPQQQLNGVNFLTVDDGTAPATAGVVQQPQQVGAVLPQVQQPVGLFLPPLPQSQQQQVGAVPVIGWLPTASDSLSGGLLWQQQQQQEQQQQPQQQPLLGSSNDGVQRAQRRAQDLQQATGRGGIAAAAAANGMEENGRGESVGEARDEAKEGEAEEDGGGTAAAGGAGTEDDEAQ